MIRASRSLFVPVLLSFLLTAPAGVQAQSLPQPIIRMSDAVIGAPASRSSTKVSFTVYETGIKTYQGSVQGMFITEAGENADAEGTLSVTVEEMRGSYFKDLFGGKKFSAGLDFKVLPSSDSLYFRITKFPKLADFTIPSLAKKWVYVDIEGYANEYASKADLSSREVLEHLVQAHRKYPAMTFTEQGSTAKEYVYIFRANPTTLMRMVNEASRLSGEAQVFSTSEISDIGARMDTVTGILRIDKRSYLPMAATYRFGFTYNEYRTSISGGSTYQYGNVKAVKKPSGAISIERWFESLFGDFGEARMKGSDAAAKSNLANARAEAELYYDDNGGSYDGVCGKGRWGIQDNVEAAAKAVGKEKGACNDSNHAWAASARLSNGKYYCVDSSGSAREVKKSLGKGTVCK